MNNLYQLDGVEIFRTGIWKGNLFEAKDLDEMVTNFERFKDTWFRPALKDGHHVEPGKPALGYIDRLWREKDKLLAKIVDMPKAVYEAIKTRRYDRVSAEVFLRLHRKGKMYRNVFEALSLLGVEVPEVDGLKPLRDNDGR